MRVLINNVDYSEYVAPGCPIKDVLGEELDSATIILSNLQKTLFEPYVDVTIETDYKTYYLVFNTSQEELIDILGSKYQYTISCVSKTKLLETVFLPNLSITKPLSGNTRSIASYINLVVLPYVRKQFPLLMLSEHATEFLNKYNCPEMNWNTPNAKQVLNNLLGTIENNPCIVTIIGNEIDYISMAELKSDISDSFFYNIIEDEDYTQMGDFSNQIVTDAKNVLSTNLQKTPYLKVSAPIGTSQLTTQNAIMQFQNIQIDKIEHLFVKLKKVVIVEETFVEDIYTTYNDIEIDIADYILEESIYGTKKEGLYTWRDTDYKGAWLYYSYGDNSVKGLTYSANSGNNPLMNVIRRAVAKRFNKTNFVANKDSIEFYDLFETQFRVEYYSIDNLRVKSYKNNPTALDTATLVSQTQSMVGFNSLTKVQNENANRLGNPLKRITCIIPNGGRIPKLGDYIEDYVLFQREIAHYSDFYMVTALLSKNFIKRSIFEGITARTRFQQLVASSESVVREELIEYDIKVSTTPYDSSNTMDSALAGYYATATPYDINAFLIRPYSSERMLPYFFLLANKQIGEKQLSLTGECFDNYAVGMRRQKEDGGIYQHYVSYVDSNGEIYQFQSYLVASLRDVDTDEFPLATSNDVYNANKYLLDFIQYQKDNSETLKLTYQFNVVSDDPNIVIGNSAGKYNVFGEHTPEEEVNMRMFRAPAGGQGLAQVTFNLGSEVRYVYYNVSDGTSILYEGNIYSSTTERFAIFGAVTLTYVAIPKDYNLYSQSSRSITLNPGNVRTYSCTCPANFKTGYVQVIVPDNIQNLNVKIYENYPNLLIEKNYTSSTTEQIAVQMFDGKLYNYSWQALAKPGYTIVGENSGSGLISYNATQVISLSVEEITPITPTDIDVTVNAGVNSIHLTLTDGNGEVLFNGAITSSERLRFDIETDTATAVYSYNVDTALYKPLDGGRIDIISGGTYEINGAPTQINFYSSSLVVKYPANASGMVVRLYKNGSAAENIIAEWDNLTSDLTYPITIREGDSYVVTWRVVPRPYYEAVSNGSGSLSIQPGETTTISPIIQKIDESLIVAKIDFIINTGIVGITYRVLDGDGESLESGTIYETKSTTVYFETETAQLSYEFIMDENYIQIPAAYKVLDHGRTYQVNETAQEKPKALINITKDAGIKKVRIRGYKEGVLGALFDETYTSNVSNLRFNLDSFTTIQWDVEANEGYEVLGTSSGTITLEDSTYNLSFSSSIVGDEEQKNYSKFRVCSAKYKINKNYPIFGEAYATDWREDLESLGNSLSFNELNPSVAWGICDKNFNLIIGCNDPTKKTLYFKLERRK